MDFDTWASNSFPNSESMSPDFLVRAEQG